MHMRALTKPGKIVADTGRRAIGYGSTMFNQPAVCQCSFSMFVRNSTPETTCSGVSEIGYGRRFSDSARYKHVPEDTSEQVSLHARHAVASLSLDSLGGRPAQITVLTVKGIGIRLQCSSIISSSDRWTETDRSLS
jgi:hypothetical protein